MTLKRNKNKPPASFENVYQKAIEVFGYDKDKAIAWYLKKQEKYGDKSPYELCKEGKAAALLKELNKTLLIQHS